MLVYNVTVKVQPDIASVWLKWQLEEHIPEIMNTSLFDDFKLYRLMEQDDVDGPTFITQFFCRSRENYDKYINDHANGLRQKAFLKWGDKFIGFRSLLESVQ